MLRTNVTLLFTTVFLLVIEGHVTLRCGISFIPPRSVNTERGVYSGTPNDRRPRFVFLAASCTNATPCNVTEYIHVLEQRSAAILTVIGEVRVDSLPLPPETSGIFLPGHEASQ